MTATATYYVQLFHWNAAEARGKAAILRAAGYTVNFQIPSGQQILRILKEHPPAAVIIDLSRLPAQGRDLGLLLRHSKSTRGIPLIYVDGDPAKVARIKELLPDAVYATWPAIRDALKRAIAHPPASPVVPKSVFDAYVGAPLTKKLGIKPNSTVALVSAPREFAENIGVLPAGVSLRAKVGKGCDLTIWFCKSRSALEKRIPAMARMIGRGRLWIAWPKRRGGAPTDLTQQQVREIGLAAGLVDFKICSIDERWSGLLFTHRRK